MLWDLFGCFGGVCFGTEGGVVFGLTGVVFATGDDLTGGLVPTTPGEVGFGTVGVNVLCAMLLIMERMLLSILLIFGELGEPGEVPCSGTGVAIVGDVTVIVLIPL